MSSEKVRFGTYILILATVVTISIVGFSVIEGLSPFDAAYLTIVTISTVGYGDITPKTEGGKILAMFVILAGVGTFLFVFAETVETMVNRQEAEARTRKINMVIGAFFSEAGVPLIKLVRSSIHDNEHLDSELKIEDAWTDQQFREAEQRLGTWNFDVDIRMVDIPAVHALLKDRRAFLVQLIQHPALFEHESFSDLLSAVFHLEEELICTGGTGTTARIGLFSSVERHAPGHQQADCPVGGVPAAHACPLSVPVSLAIRTNPFDPNASPVIR